MAWKSILKAIGENALTVVAASGVPGVSIGAGIAKSVLNREGVLSDVIPYPAPFDVVGQIDAIIASVERTAAALKANGGTMSSEQKKAVAVSEAMTVIASSFALAGRKVGDEALMREAIDQSAQACAMLVEARVKFMNALKAND
jgi:hypothetical protein